MNVIHNILQNDHQFTQMNPQILALRPQNQIDTLQTFLHPYPFHQEHHHYSPRLWSLLALPIKITTNFKKLRLCENAIYSALRYLYTPELSLNVVHFWNITWENTANGRPEALFLNSLLGMQSVNSISGYRINPKNSIILDRIKLFSTFSGYSRALLGETVIPVRVKCLSSSHCVTLKVGPAGDLVPRVHFVTPV